MQDENVRMTRSRLLSSILTPILCIVLAGYLLSIGWGGTALWFTLFAAWDITNSLYLWRNRTDQTSPVRSFGYDYSLLHNRIFLAVFCGLVIFQSYGLEYSWIPVAVLILWEITRRFFIGRKADQSPN
jgi:hypothetical protein